MPANHDESFSDELLPDADVRAVVTGFNCRINYRVLAYAHHVLHRKPENLFIATNSDAQYPAAGRVRKKNKSCFAREKHFKITRL